MRPLTTLYRIAYGRIMLARTGDYRGICHLIITLHKDKLITDEEATALHFDLYKNKPSEKQHLCFYAEENFMGDDYPYWWEAGDMETRKKFLARMIHYSKPWYVKLYLLWTNQL